LLEGSQGYDIENKKITITISPDTTLSEAVCKAINPQQAQCNVKGLHQTVKASGSQDLIDAREGSSAYQNGEWRYQIGVMLG